MLRYFAFVAGVALFTLACVWYGDYSGAERRDKFWENKWALHLADDAKATREAEAKEREQESIHATQMAGVSEHGQQIIDGLQAQLAAERDSHRSVQQSADAFVGRLVDSQARLSACVTDASKAATEAARVLADVFKSADDRAGILAGAADQAIERGLNCESAYQVISNSKEGSK